MGVAPTRRIAPGSINRDRLLASDQAGRNLHLHVCNGCFLRFGEAANIIMGESNIVFQLLRHFSSGSCNVGFAQ